MVPRFILAKFAKLFADPADRATAPTAVNPTTILDCYFKTAPSLQNAIDIFTGEWASKFPPPHDQLSAGTIPVFQDGRLLWGIQQLGGVYGQNVLELGPLEGAHSYMLERAGATSITAIEANSRAFLKCLITKEIFNLVRSRFLCGDFVPYLENTSERFDVIVASGVLYHMKDPIKLLELIARRTDRVYLWTHYFDQQIIAEKPYLQVRFNSQNKVKVGGSVVTEYRHEYQQSLQTSGFSGGSSEYSTWLSREDLMLVLRETGFTHFEFSWEMPDHPHGPCLSMIAVRR
jgi:SAM-dependent methyltransferase